MDGALVSSASSVSTAASSQRWTYDVFLSFRGEDTRKSFVDHLYSALDQAGIYTFKDDEKLQRGKSISPELAKAIQESMVAVVVFSKNYANSSWCLEELGKIIECRDVTGQRVLPVFYDVEPSDVRGQKNSFQEAFEQHEVKFADNMDRVKRWREALVTAANLSGWDVPKTACGHEAECIKRIVRHILSYTESLPTENMIGMESRLQHVKYLLSKRNDDVSMIGIWGMGGIGKTTIARAVYHQISYEFEGTSFLEDVRENGSNKKGLKCLQEKLLSEILMQPNFVVKDCDDGARQIQRRLGRKKVLVVLDDIDSFKQLEFLAGSCEWFGPGSRIIVTTRDEHLLCYAQEKYVPELLEKTEAMELFSRYAFKANIPPKAYVELSYLVVGYTGHLPLALKVLGSHFCGRNFEFWESALNVLAKIPHREITESLKLSYDALNDYEKKIFLHIACFFKGKKRRYVTRILDSCGYEAVSGVTVLVEKCLLTISNGNLYMHDLIQEMGRCIVRRLYPNSMLWVPEEIEEVMTNTAKLEIVEAIVENVIHKEYYDYMGKHFARCSADAFVRMKKLRLLQVQREFTLSEPSNFPEELRWLCWYWYPFQSLTITGGMTKLAAIDMQCGEMQQLQIEQQVILTNLKFINLCGSLAITSFPDVSGVPNLESLDLSYCEQLVEVHQSVLLHERIIHLDMSGCFNLQVLPSSIHMKSLQILLLSYCRSLERFPEVSGEMGRLLLLDIRGCERLKAIPLSSRRLTGLAILMMGIDVIGYNVPAKESKLELEQTDCTRILPIQLETQDSSSLNSLRILDLANNNLVEDDFSSYLESAWPSLEEMDLSSNPITRLPLRVSQLYHLKYLDLNGCEKLEELHELPSLIQVLNAHHCTSLQKIGDFSNKCKWLFKISLHGCLKLLEDEESVNHVANLLTKSLVQKCAAVNYGLSITVPGTKIPNWFTNQCLGNTIALTLPQNQITRMKGLAICCVFHLRWMDELCGGIAIKFKPLSKDKLICGPALAHAAESADHVWIGYISIDFIENLCHGIESEHLIISIESNFNVVAKCGMCIVYKDDVRPMTGNGSWIPDYDGVGRIDRENVDTEDLRHGRWSFPTFGFGNSKAADHNSFYVKC